MAGQNEGARVFDGALKILTDNVSTNGYKFHNGITIDSSLFVPYQTTFIANEDTWQGEWYEINTNTTTLTDETEAETLNTNNTINTNSW